MRGVIFSGIFFCVMSLYSGNYSWVLSSSEKIVTEQAGVEEIKEVYKKDKTEEDNTSWNDEVYEIWELLDVDKLSKEIDEMSEESTISFTLILSYIRQGDYKTCIRVIKDAVVWSVIYEIETGKKYMLNIALIIILGALMANVSFGREKGFISENGFYITYMIIVSMVLAVYQISNAAVSEALEFLIKVAGALCPVYLGAIEICGCRTEATFLQGIFIGVIWVIEVILKNLLLPAIRFFLVVSLVNNISREKLFTKLTELLKKLITDAIKLLLGLTIGVNAIKAMIAPGVDSYRNNMVNRFISMLPQSGIINSMVSTFVGAGNVIRGSIGAAGVIFMGTAVLVPVMKILTVMLMSYLASALLEPVGDKRYSVMLSKLGESMNLLFYTIFLAVCMFMISIALVMNP